MIKMNQDYHQAISDLQQIPGVGSSIAKAFINLGIYSTADLKGGDPEALFRELETKNGKAERSILYHFRCAVYYASNETYDSEKLKWWHWKDPR